MNDRQEAFLSAINDRLEGLEFSSSGYATKSCPACLDIFPDHEGEEEPEDEGSFSWSQCDSCGTTLGGDRHVAHAFTKEMEVIHLDICTNCHMFHANGDLPDGD